MTATSVFAPKLVVNKMTQEQYDALAYKSPTELYYIVNGEGKLVVLDHAGTRVEFDGTVDIDLSSGVYSATYASNFQAGGNIESVLNSKEVKLTSANAGEGISISRDSNDKVTITNTNRKATWGQIEGTITNQTDLKNALDAKADASSVYTKTEIDTTVSGLNTEIAKKADKATTLAGYGITNAYTKTEVDTQISTLESEKLDKSEIENYYTKAEVYNKSEIDGKLVGTYHVKPGVATVNDLPLTGNVQGDCRNVADTGNNYVWTSSSSSGTLEDWDKLSSTMDLSAYRTAADQDIIDATLLSKTEAANSYETIADADEVKERVTALEETVGDSTSGLVKDVADNATAISNEITRATTAEAGLNTDIEGIDTRVGTLENTVGDSTKGLVKSVADNATAISTEATRASQAELSLTTAITNETTRATTKESQLQADVDSKASQTDLDTLESAVALKAEQSSLSAEITRATEAEQALEQAKADKATTLAGYNISDAYTKTEIDSKIAGVYHVKPGVATVSDLPLTGNTQGDCRNVAATGDNYVWTSSSASGTAADWDKLSGTVDLSAYRTAADQDAIDSTLLTKIEATSTYETVVNVEEVKERVSTVETTISGYGDAVYHNSADFATAIQGAKADTAVQPAAIADMETKTNAANTYATQTALGQTNANVTTLQTKVGDASSGLTKDVADNATAISNESERAEQAEQALDEAKADKATSLSGYNISDAFTKTEINSKVETINTAISGLQTSKADVSALDDYYTKSETYNKTEVDSLVAGAFHVKAGVATLGDLPLTGNKQGDCRNVASTGDNYVWTSSSSSGTLDDWDKLSGLVDLSAYRTASAQDIIDSTLLGKIEASSTYETIVNVDEVKGKVTGLETTVGDSTSGLVKDVADNAAAISTEATRASQAEQALDTNKADKTTVNTHIQDELIHIQESERTAWNNKQDRLTSANAGTGISIDLQEGKVVISSTQVSAEWGNITGNIGSQQDLKAALDLKADVVDISAEEARATAAENAIDAKVETNIYNIGLLRQQKEDVLTDENAGEGISITRNEATGEVLISNTRTSAEWGNITGTLSDQTDLQAALDAKEDRVKQWSANTLYKPMDLVLWDEKLFLCIVEHTSTSSFDRTKFNNVSALSDKVGTWHSQSFTTGTEATTVEFTLSSVCDSVNNLFVFESGRVNVPRSQITLSADGLKVTVTEDFAIPAGTIFDINWIEFTSQVGLHSPYMTGIPTAVTPATSVDSDQIATTAFVHTLFEDEDIEIVGGAGNDW